MIQRIQTVYLLLALFLTGDLFFINMANLASETATYKLIYSGIEEVASTPAAPVMPASALTILLCMTVLLIVITIFMFKKRLLQIRIAGLSLGLLAGLSGLIFYFGKAGAKELAAEVSYTPAIVLPLIAIILVILAIRAIGKDEALVKSLDRIR
ncbi:DUF4293 domain-containing protein [Geofilum sp. OHC36d9]|uniref:DUF4293 domain-containing protein n=1 Tax=Geofilum sp. OHC36d9 TaxID=3458413 RepID=UPI0040347AA8